MKAPRTESSLTIAEEIHEMRNAFAHLGYSRLLHEIETDNEMLKDGVKIET
jgi:hypothetical protein